MNLNIREWRVIWFFFRPYRFHCMGVLAFMLLTGLLETLNLAALYPIINYGLNLGANNTVLRHFERFTQNIAPGDPFLVACVLFIVISILAIGSKFVYSYFSNKLLVRIVGDTQKKVFDRFVSADYDFFVRGQQGQLIYAGTTAPERVVAVVNHTVAVAFHAINVLFLFPLLLVLSWQATILVLLLGLFYGVVIQKIMRTFIHRCSAIMVEESRRRNVILNEFITGIKTIKVYLAANEWQERFGQAVDRGLLNSFRLMMAVGLPGAFVRFIFYLFLAGAAMFFSRKHPGEIMAILPVFGTFVMVANRFLPSAQGLGSSVMEIGKSLPDINIVHELCRDEIVLTPDGVMAMEGFKDRITFENVWFKYQSMTDDLLKGLSFSIEQKKMTALVGLSGAGKTTIINLLLKLYRPDQGTIKIDGVDIRDLSNKSYLASIGYVGQEPFIFNNSFKENIRFGMSDCTDEMVREAAILANADEFIRETPDGYGTIVGDSGVKLSGGERQRVAIARAMLRKPAIIVLDEATSSLDNISEKKIQTAINNISKHTTVLVIAHRLTTVQGADKIIILDKGEIIEEGTHEELLSHKNLYYELYTTRDPVDGVVVEEKIG